MRDDVSTLIARNLKTFRERLGWSQAALAEHSGVPRPTIAHLEAGQANPTLSVALRVARALGVSVDGLVEAADENIVAFGPEDQRTVRSAKFRRTELVAGLSMREGVFERVVLKPGGKVLFELGDTTEGGFAYVAEGSVTFRTPEETEELGAERAAWFRVPVDVASGEGAVVYRLSGVTHSPRSVKS